MKGLLFLIIGAVILSNWKKENQPGLLLSAPVYTIAIGRWYKDKPRRIKIRRSKKGHPGRQGQMYILVYG